MEIDNLKFNNKAETRNGLYFFSLPFSSLMFIFLFFPIAQAGVITDAPSISSVGMNVLNFLLSVVGIIAIISLALSGIIYLTAMDDKKRMQAAKRATTYSIVGVALALGGMILIKLIGQFF